MKLKLYVGYGEALLVFAIDSTAPGVLSVATEAILLDTGKMRRRRDCFRSESVTRAIYSRRIAVPERCEGLRMARCSVGHVGE